MNTGQELSVTQLLASLRHGDGAAVDAIFPLVYAQLRHLAQNQLAAEGIATLAPTELVHEAYLKLCGGQVADATDRRHFVAIAARAMRQVLVDGARHRNAIKRDGGERVTLTTELPGEFQSVDMLALDQALSTLAGIDPRKARAVELRVFAGLPFDEVAATLDISRATLARDYRSAQAWLYRELEMSDAAGSVP